MTSWPGHTVPPRLVRAWPLLMLTQRARYRVATRRADSLLSSVGDRGMAMRGRGGWPGWPVAARNPAGRRGQGSLATLRSSAVRSRRAGWRPAVRSLAGRAQLGIGLGQAAARQATDLHTRTSQAEPGRARPDQAPGRPGGPPSGLRRPPG